jgi:hypothetical protein
MRDTTELRAKMLDIWNKVDANKMTAVEARIRIGLARTILDSLKVEIAAAHLKASILPAVPMTPNPTLTLRRRAA